MKCPTPVVFAVQVLVLLGLGLVPILAVAALWPGNPAAIVLAVAFGGALSGVYVWALPTAPAKPSGRSGGVLYMPPGHEPGPEDVVITWGVLTSRIPPEEAERIALGMLAQARDHRARARAAAGVQKAEP